MLPTSWETTASPLAPSTKKPVTSMLLLDANKAGPSMPGGPSTLETVRSSTTTWLSESDQMATPCVSNTSMPVPLRSESSNTPTPIPSRSSDTRWVPTTATSSSQASACARRNTP